MPIELVREYSFSAAHHLPWHPGKCLRRHGHTYRLEIAVAGELDERGVIADFAELDEVVAPVLAAGFDHHDLNDLMDNPTAENIAVELAVRLGPLVPQDLIWLRLWEGPRSSVILRLPFGGSTA